MKTLANYRWKILLIIFLTTIILNQQANAQTLNTDPQRNKLPFFRAGLSLFVSGVGTDDPQYQESGAFFPGLTLNPGFRIINGSLISLAISAPLTIGFMLPEDDDYVSFGYDLPIAGEVTIGMGACSRKQQPFGLMVGYGVGHHRSYYSDIDEYGNKHSSVVSFNGKLLYTGLIFPIGRNAQEDTDGLKGIMIRISYMEKVSPLNPFSVSVGAILLFKSLNQ
jgi:hypothetical protein